MANARNFFSSQVAFALPPTILLPTDSVLQQEGWWDLAGQWLLHSLAKSTQTEGVRNPSKKEQSLALFPHVIFLHCQKSAMAKFSKVFCPESGLLSWARSSSLCSSVLTPPVATFCFEICACQLFGLVRLSQHHPVTGALRQCAESNIIQPDWGLQFLAWCLGEHRSALLSFLCLGPCPLTLSADVLDWCTLSTRCDTGIKCSGFEAPNLGIIFSSELESQSKFEIFMNLN